MKDEFFLESLSNISGIDYMHVRKGIDPKFFLDRVLWFVKTIPDIYDKLPHQRFIHITGTSGKGTVGAMLMSILKTAGFSVGFYHSPHVHTVYERILFSPPREQPSCIPPRTFTSFVTFLKPYLENALLKSPCGIPSYFEILLIIALMYFTDKKCQYIILEVGCGGRFDATNLIPTSDLSIITTIDLDHEHLIGPTKENIAYEKAGIIKHNSKILLGPSIKGKIRALIQKEAQKKHAALYTTPLPPSSDKKNIATWNKHIARKAGQILSIQKDFIIKGIQNYTPLPGRFEIIHENPIIILDGAHNPEKINYLVHCLKKYAPSEKKTLIFTAGEHKNWQRMLDALIPLFDKIIITRHNVIQKKIADLRKMYAYCILKKREKSSVFFHLDPADALKKALKCSPKHNSIVVTGSLYLLGPINKIVQNIKL